ncbi:MAG: hypothetical protein ACOCV7_05365 [Desulfonatronovibrionaceae bacterium]
MNPEQLKLHHQNELSFFGLVSANVSHEIKNYLAVINELGGLLEDISLMAGQKSRELDPERTKDLAASITAQVSRADHVIKAFNYFSHSVDKKYCHIDLYQLTMRMITLTARLAGMKSTEIRMDEQSTDNLSLYTRPFALEQLFLFCLEQIMRSGPDPKTATVLTRGTNEKAELVFVSSTELPEQIPRDKQLDFICRQLSAEIRLSAGRTTITVSLPGLDQP